MSEVKYAGFWWRFLAHIIDSTLLTLVSVLLELAVLGIAYWILILTSTGPVSFFSTFSGMLLQVLNIFLYTVIGFFYYGYGHFRWGATLGKMAVGVYVADARDGGGLSFSQSMFRYLAYFLSYLPMGTGYLMAAFHPKKQALHDVITQTVVLKKA